MEKLSNKITLKESNQSLFCYYLDEDCLRNSPKYLHSNVVDLIITDPPYGINGDQLHQHYNRDESFVLDGYTEIPIEEYETFSYKWIAEAERVLKPGGSMYLFSGWTNLRHILNAVDQTGLCVVNHIIWKYNFGVFTRQKFTTSHYHILYLVKPGAKPTFNTFCRFSPTSKNENKRSLIYADMEDVWIIDREYKKGKKRHKNELPKELLIKLIQYSSHEGDLIVDFFAGSFSTIKAAKALNRSGIGFEISKQACEYQISQVAEIQWGEWLDKVRKGYNDNPKNQYKPWTDEDKNRLKDRYLQIREQGVTKRQAIQNLQQEYERGYFAVLNALKTFDL